LLAVIAFSFLYKNGNLVGVFVPASANTPVVLPTSTFILKPTSTNTLPPLTAPVVVTDIATTNTVPPSPIYTETAIPTPTEIILGIGYINKASVSTWKEPNNGLIEKLGINHPITILEEKIVANSKWYRCRWESNEIDEDGWILAEYITIGTPTTP
jgi:hypothetical protein